jgi:hypothetical protein
MLSGRVPFFSKEFIEEQKRPFEEKSREAGQEIGLLNEDKLIPLFESFAALLVDEEKYLDPKEHKTEHQRISQEYSALVKQITGLIYYFNSFDFGNSKFYAKLLRQVLNNVKQHEETFHSEHLIKIYSCYAHGYEIEENKIEREEGETPEDALDDASESDDEDEAKEGITVFSANKNEEKEEIINVFSKEFLQGQRNILRMASYRAGQIDGLLNQEESNQLFEAIENATFNRDAYQGYSSHLKERENLIKELNGLFANITERVFANKDKIQQGSFNIYQNAWKEIRANLLTQIESFFQIEFEKILRLHSSPVCSLHDQWASGLQADIRRQEKELNAHCCAAAAFCLCVLPQRLIKGILCFCCIMTDPQEECSKHDLSITNKCGTHETLNCCCDRTGSTPEKDRQEAMEAKRIAGANPWYALFCAPRARVGYHCDKVDGLNQAIHEKENELKGTPPPQQRMS